MASAFSSFSEWLSDVLRAPSSCTAVLSSELRFPSAEGLIIVQEELPLQHASHGSLARARCLSSGFEYDLRTLSVGAQEGGFVSLEALEAIDREANVAERVGINANVYRCHGSLVQNLGATHSRLLLCEASTSDLATHLADYEDMSLREVSNIGQQLAFGLGHLHSLGIVAGSLLPSGILCGYRDGLWKLSDFSRAAILPFSASEWRELCGAKPQETPPEARSRGRNTVDEALKPEADVWLLGATLSMILFGLSTTGNPGGNAPWPSLTDGAPAIPPKRLTDPEMAQLWLLLHWFLAESPENRPCAREAAALLGAVMLTPAKELLEEMPLLQRQSCRNIATAAARQLAVDLLVENSANKAVWELAELPLEKLRTALADPSQVDLLCTNCGLDSSGMSLSVLEDERTEQLKLKAVERGSEVAELARGALAKEADAHAQSEASTFASNTSDDSTTRSSGSGALGVPTCVDDKHCSTNIVSTDVESQPISADLLGLFD